MSEKTFPKLCGGTFFVLLLQAKQKSSKARNSVLGDSDGKTEVDVLRELIKVYNPDYRYEETAIKSVRSDCTSFKKCEKEKGTYLPFDPIQDAGLIATFNNEVLTEYATARGRMQKFIDGYVDVKHSGKWLVKAIIELIDADKTIEKDDKFFITGDGKPITRSEFVKQVYVDLASFLLGVWHYIVCKPVNNKAGDMTYQAWFKSEGEHTRPVFVSSIGQDSERVVVLKEEVETHSEEVHIEKTDRPEECFAYDYADYISLISEKYSTLKTLLYSDAPRPFYDFYVCNDVRIGMFSREFIESRVERGSNPFDPIQDLTIDKVQSEISNFVILTGTGGLGKSMMMRHLLLNTAERYLELVKIPIFVPLKDYTTKVASFRNYVYGVLKNSVPGLTEEEFIRDLSEGHYVLLLDGLDEIKSNLRTNFEQRLETFTDQFGKNVFMMSSRPFQSFVSFSRFTTIELSPFSKEQALRLIELLDFRPDEPNIKKKFYAELESHLYTSHREFADNPLLLTIMLMTYEQFAEVPSKMHVFYREAYLALSQKHDASKGAYKRALKTGLSSDRFSDYFAEFCARTYQAEKFDLSREEIKRFFDSLNERKKFPDEQHITATDFLEDLTSGICLMYMDGGKYHFAHRSFQEYFCALYFSKQKDKFLGEIGKMFEKATRRIRGDETFAMLYDMIPNKVEEYIFTPTLEDIFAKCDKDNGYWTFLQIMYPHLEYGIGKTRPALMRGVRFIRPKSYIYEFIGRKNRCLGVIGNEQLPYVEDFVRSEFLEVEAQFRGDDDPETIIVEKEFFEEVDDEGRIYFNEARYKEAKTVGWHLSFEIKTVLADQAKYQKIRDALNSDDFPLKTEYYSMRKYLNDLRDKQTSSGDSLFDLLT